jgi:hypothetical protein
MDCRCSIGCDTGQDGRVFLYAFDLLELNGQDMRRKPLEARLCLQSQWKGSRQLRSTSLAAFLVLLAHLLANFSRLTYV